MKPTKISENELRKLLVDLIATIEKFPNDQELGENLRLKYWHDLKQIKKDI